MQSILNVSGSFYKNNLLMLFGYNNNRKDYNINDIEELDNLINVIEKEERFANKKQKKKNIVMSKPFNFKERGGVIMNTSHISSVPENNNKKITIKAQSIKHFKKIQNINRNKNLILEPLILMDIVY